jgi:putative acetyltransferase
MISISAETTRHRPPVLALHRQAFGGEVESMLIEDLHAAGLIVSSLVAVSDGTVVGHILFSDLTVKVDGRSIAAVSLAPMAVLPKYQRRGIGTHLVGHGLEDVRKKGRTAVIVLGHPEFYPRFGFSAALAQKLASPYAGPAFMALELVPGSLAGERGLVRYPGAFGAAGAPA